MAGDEENRRRADRNNDGGVLQGLAKAESMLQLAIVLPVATLIGWAIGTYLDHKLHQEWIAIVGLIFGAVAGFVQIYRVASAAMRRN
ncbi:MAG: AtpZ/AtpI family protein [Acidobacteriaceae bacterium]